MKKSKLLMSAVAIVTLIVVGGAGFLLIRAWQDASTPEHALPTPVEGSSEGVPVPDEDDGTPLGLRLSEGKAQPDIAAPSTFVRGETLADDELASLLDRLPALIADPADAVDFNLPGEVIPPPRPGETLEESFPPDADAATVTAEYGDLEVLRYSPEGEIPIAPFVNITFNQPMVPLTTIEDLVEMDVPVQISPALPGTWRWLGTKTLNFQYDSELIDRMPMATEYQVVIPAGTESAVGGVLGESVEFTFSTPALQMDRHLPYSGEPQPLEPLFFISFNQRIDPENLLGHIAVNADGRNVDIKLATEEEIAEDETISAMVENAQESRYLVFRAYESLPADAETYVTIEGGAPSAEGPLLTTSALSYSFYTYAPLKLTDHHCGWGDECRPLMPLTIEFNNPIDAEDFDESLLEISPELLGVSVNVYGNTIQISGMTEGRTTYKVKVSGEIKDIFGQMLGRDEQVRFKIGSANPFLVGPDQRFITLDPSDANPAISLYVMNYKKLDVQIYAVQPSDWAAYLKYLDEYQWTDEHIDPPGKLLLDETQKVDAKTDVLTEINLDLSEYLQGDFGHFAVMVKPHQSIFETDNYYETVNVWAQVTQIGLDAFSDHSEFVIWTSSLADGAPLGNVKISADDDDVNATTGEDGIAKLDLPSGGASYLTAQIGDDIAMLPRNTHYWDEYGWTTYSVSDILRWFVYDDRAMYRPGEEVHLKGWIRNVGGGQLGDISLFGDALTGVNYSLIGAQGNELATGRVDVNLLGGFDLVLELPENVNLGYTQLQLNAEGSLNVDYYSHTHSFQIQEFRRPEFEVLAGNETEAPYFVGEHAIVAVEAKYFAGGALPNAETNWWVNSSETNYSPPNWNKFTFGFWTPWWHYFDGGFEEPQSESFTGVTDGNGEHFLRIDFDGETTRPTSITAEATVMDLNRQAWTSATSLLVHPADLYVGIRSERYFVERGEPLEIEAILTDLEGNAIADRQITIEAARVQWKSQGGWHEALVDPQTCEITSTLEPISCSFETSVGGRYQITATITDAEGRKNQSRFTRWVSGGERPPSRNVEQEEITLIPDKDEYQPGDVAEILVQTPFTPAEILVTVSRSGILYTERHLIEEGTQTLRVPIRDEQIPNIHIQVDAVGAAPRVDDAGDPVVDAPARPAYATANLNLSIPPYTRTLAVDAILADAEIEPGEKTTLDLELKDASGNPVANAELAVVVVDESILALTNYQLADPITTFYSQRSSDLSSVYGRASIVLTNPLALAEAARGAENEVMATQSLDDSMFKSVGEGAVMEEAMEMAAAPMAEMEADGMGGSGAPQPQIAVRSDFNPLAAFEAEVRTDENGKATLQIEVPDNLTRYRVMVVAVDSGGNQFGKTESSLTARLPLMVRPSAPRFLNFGDKFELPILLQNQTDEDIEVDVALQATNITLPEGAGQRVTVPANDRVEVRFAAETEMAGIAQFQIGAVSGSYADAATLELPVYTPATTEAFATYGVVDEGAIAQPIAKPSDVYAQFGGLEIQTSSTALQTLTDAVMYLAKYPYACTEQLSSRIMGIAALRDVLNAFQAEGLPSADEMVASVNRDVTRLQGIQNYDGGFPYWRRGQESIPFNTIHVAHALQRAKDKGFEIPPEMQENLRYYLTDIESHYPHWYSQYTRRVLSAYALYVRDLMGDNDAAKARNLLQEAPLEDFSFEAIGWIWQVLVDDPNAARDLDLIRVYVNNHVVETAGAANFTTSYDDQTYLILSSNRRADAVLLDAMIADDPNADLIPKLVNGLLAHRTRGRWGSTQENVFVLLAMDRYFNTYEAQTPDFVARIWLGETYAGEHAYEGYSTNRHETNIPMTYLVDGADWQDLTLSKEGVGRLYYRLGLKYAPTDLNLDPLDMGFVVTREYEGVDDVEDVWQDEDGIWHIKAGARVRVKIKMVADNRRYHVALVDPLPAGLEIVNPDLAVSSNAGVETPNPFERMYGWWWWGTWYEHQNLRDERAEAFTSLLWDGVYDYSYIARATTPGTFVAPPAKAEEMYSPEVFGRSGSDWVVVEAE
ncbi:MAG: hypothetical protein HN736_03810 [Anaerolineae bacterium]|jgi:hypothetical protein|nr:hypothetical protein [Anaerolineae bacterium]MBT4309867.1 hypothetical protein [Anaerolineae bacterium]MBT4457518.1 hypothetical protein [Anaerolineae bacterium]MBT6060773.1 hypothetical protein [Anaerolineae bacterium]MBT6321825.1 hypothetical protein [Anaerolineae bacterium]